MQPLRNSHYLAAFDHFIHRTTGQPGRFGLKRVAFSCEIDSGAPQKTVDRDPDSAELPLRISDHLATFSSRFYPKQVRFGRNWLKLAAVSCEIGQQRSKLPLL